jgi:hypothetical protein
MCERQWDFPFFVTTNAWIMWFAVPALVARFRYARRRRRDPEAGRTRGRVTQPPVATGREGSATQLDQEPT